MRVQSAGARRQLPLTKRTRYVPGTRSVKSRTPWRPGFTPVTSEVQAGKVAAGTVERSGPHAPVAVRGARTGSGPAAADGRTRSSVAPSRPITSRRGTDRSFLDVSEGLETGPRRRVHAGLFACAPVLPRLEHRAPERRTHAVGGVARRARDHVLPLAGVVRQVVELLGSEAARVPFVGGDQLPFARAHRLEDVALEVLLGERALPRRCGPTVERQRVPRQGLGYRQPCGCEDGRRDVEAGRQLFKHPTGSADRTGSAGRPRSVRARRLHDERHVDLLVVERRAVPPAAVLVELLAVVRRQDDERLVVEAAAPQVVE